MKKPILQVKNLTVKFGYSRPLMMFHLICIMVKRWRSWVSLDPVKSVTAMSIMRLVVWLPVAGSRVGRSAHQDDGSVIYWCSSLNG